MNTKRFEYPLWQKVMRATMMLVAVLVVGFGVIILPTISFILQDFEHPIMERIEGPDPSSLIAALVVGPILLTGAYAVLIMHPNIEVRGERFRLYALWYRSSWLSWDAVSEVRELSFSPSWSRQIGIAVEGVSPLYFLAGVTQHFGYQKTFIIQQSLRDFKGFFALLQEKRPDLFIMESWK